MSRNLTSAVSTALSGDNVPGLVLVELYLDEGTLYLCNATYSFTWNGNTYLGAGAIGRIDPIEEGAMLEAYGVKMSLSAIPSGMINTALNTHYKGRTVKIYYAPLDQNYNIINNPVLAFSGRIDTMEIQVGQTGTIVLTAESRFADWDRPRIMRYNDADQKRFYPGNISLDLVEYMVNKALLWGKR